MILFCASGWKSYLLVYSSIGFFFLVDSCIVLLLLVSVCERTRAGKANGKPRVSRLFGTCHRKSNRALWAPWHRLQAKDHSNKPMAKANATHIVFFCLFRALPIAISQCRCLCKCVFWWMNRGAKSKGWKEVFFCRRVSPCTFCAHTISPMRNKKTTSSSSSSSIDPAD